MFSFYHNSQHLLKFSSKLKCTIATPQCAPPRTHTHRSVLTGWRWDKWGYLVLRAQQFGLQLTSLAQYFLLIVVFFLQLHLHLFQLRDAWTERHKQKNRQNHTRNRLFDCVVFQTRKLMLDAPTMYREPYRDMSSFCQTSHLGFCIFVVKWIKITRLFFFLTFICTSNLYFTKAFDVIRLWQCASWRSQSVQKLSCNIWI